MFVIGETYGQIWALMHRSLVSAAILEAAGAIFVYTNILIYHMPSIKVRI